MEMALDDVIALEHRAHPIQELNRINLRAMTMQKTFDKHHDRNRAGQQDQPQQPALRSSTTLAKMASLFIRSCSARPKPKILSFRSSRSAGLVTGCYDLQ